MAFNYFNNRKFLSGKSMEEVKGKLKAAKSWIMISEIKYEPSYNEPYRVLVKFDN